VSRSLAEPLGDPAVLPTFLLAEAARGPVKVILSAKAQTSCRGYPTYLGHKFASRWQSLPGPASGRRRGGRWNRGRPPPAR